MEISKLLRVILVMEIVALLGATMRVARDYQDSWILEGLEIPFIIFIATYIAYSFVENRISWIITFAVIVRCVFLIIPNLKYNWFLGVQYDHHIHYRLYQIIYSEGFVPTNPLYNNLLYLHTPLMHILFSIVTLVTTFPPLVTFKYLPLISWLPYPMIIYLVMKNSVPKDQKSLKYALFVSSIPVNPSISYQLIGTLFGALFLMILVALFTYLLQSTKRNLLIIVLVYSFALVFQHSYSPIVLVMGLMITQLLYKTKYAKTNYSTFNVFKAGYLTFLVVLVTFWLTHFAKNLFTVGSNILTQWLNAIIGISPQRETFTYIQPALFELSLENQLRIVIVHYGGDLFFIFLTLLGMIVAFKKYSSSKPLIFITLFLLSIWSFFIFQLILPAAKAGLIEFLRIFYYSLAFSPIFIGLLLSYIHKKVGNKKLISFVLCFVVILATVELYGYQPLLPIASSVRSNLPSDEYIVYVDSVNSAYQRYMVAHAEEHIINGMIVCDPITRNQILGLTDYTFSQNHLLGWYPFSNNLTQEEFDYFLIHVPGKSGWTRVKPEVGTRDFIFEAACNSSIVYSNGESYILTIPFMYHNKP